MPVVDKADDVNEDTAIEIIDAENVEITELQRTQPSKKKKKSRYFNQINKKEQIKSRKQTSKN